MYAIITSVARWRHFLIRQHFTIWTDHKNLEILFEGRGNYSNSRLDRWTVFLTEFTFTAKYIRGDDNIVADFLSRDGVESTILHNILVQTRAQNEDKI